MKQITAAYSEGGIGGASGWTIFGFNPVAPRLHLRQFSTFGNLSSTYAENVGETVDEAKAPPYEGTFEVSFSSQNGASASQVGAQGKAKGTVTYSTWQVYADLDTIMMGGMPIYVLVLLPTWCIDASVTSTYLVYEEI